jgi:hypothetical protein
LSGDPIPIHSCYIIAKIAARKSALVAMSAAGAAAWLTDFFAGININMDRRLWQQPSRDPEYRDPEYRDPQYRDAKK